LHRAAPLARRRLDGADRGRDARAEPRAREVRLGRVSERLVVVARANPRRGADDRDHRLPARQADARAAGGVHAFVAVLIESFKEDTVTKPLLSLHGVSKVYGKGPNEARVLSNVDLEIADGEFV